MILSEALQSATKTLLRTRIADASVEAELLLGHVLGISKTQLYTEPERALTSAETKHLRRLVQRRLDHEPTAYILGHCEFYGIDFCVDCHTFIPDQKQNFSWDKPWNLPIAFPNRESKLP